MKDPGSSEQSVKSPQSVNCSAEKYQASPGQLSPEAEQSGAVGRVGEDVEKTQDCERHNILDVILVSSPHPLNILVRPGLGKNTMLTNVVTGLLRCQ